MTKTPDEFQKDPAKIVGVDTFCDGQSDRGTHRVKQYNGGRQKKAFVTRCAAALNGPHKEKILSSMFAILPGSTQICLLSYGG